MTWGSPSGRSRWGPAKLAYGGTAGPEEEQLAFEASLSAGVDLFDTAAMYSGGASERRVGELAEGRRVVIATKFPPGWLSKAQALPDALDQSLVRLRRSTIDLYQHHFPSRRISIPYAGSVAVAHRTGCILPNPGAKNGRQAASNAEALSFTLVAAEIEALDQATTAWQR
jgi:aryl-alcohol dehydrogenase-like predicted oxidoreductase